MARLTERRMMIASEVEGLMLRQVVANERNGIDADPVEAAPARRRL